MSLPLTLTRRGRAFVLSAAALFALWLFVGLRDIWYLVAFLGSMVFIAVIWVSLQRIFGSFVGHFSVSNPTPTVGHTITFSLYLEHRSTMRVWGYFAWNLADRPLIEPELVNFNRHLHAEHEWVSTGRGPIVAHVPALRIVDPLGLAAWRVAIDAAADLLVLPKTIDSLAEVLTPDRLLHGADGVPSGRIIAGDSGTPGGAVRHYRTGDAPRQIHWKQSARQGELLVNLHESLTNPEQTLVLITDRDAYPTQDSFEAAVSATATIATLWVHQGSTVHVHLGQEPSVVCETENEVLRLLANAEVQEKGSSRFIPQLKQAPFAIITATLTQHLSQDLDGATFNSRIVALDRAHGATIPQGWHTIALTPHLDIPAGIRG